MVNTFRYTMIMLPMTIFSNLNCFQFNSSFLGFNHRLKLPLTDYIKGSKLIINALYLRAKATKFYGSLISRKTYFSTRKNQIA